jgi:L-ribulose-5-phosphate 4-epimerase
MSSAELDALREEVCRVNKEIGRSGLAMLTWGNASGIDRESGTVVIKPSGVDYGDLTPDLLVALDLATGEVLGGSLRPSSDTATHLHLYREFAGIGGVVHTHSHFATAWAQACREIPCYGTTHADYAHGAVPLTRAMTEAETAGEYELNTGQVIAERLREGGLDPKAYPGVLVASHGPFAWGASTAAALESAIVLEEVARMAYHTATLNPDIGAVPQHLLDKHFLRKHGEGAYYGQP